MMVDDGMMVDDQFLHLSFSLSPTYNPHLTISYHLTTYYLISLRLEEGEMMVIDNTSIIG